MSWSWGLTMEVRIATCWNQLWFLALLQNEDCPANWRNPSVTLTGWETNLTWICSRPPFWGFFPNFYTATIMMWFTTCRKTWLGTGPKAIWVSTRHHSAPKHRSNARLADPGGPGEREVCIPIVTLLCCWVPFTMSPWQTCKLRGNGTLLSTPEVEIHVWWF